MKCSLTHHSRIWDYHNPHLKFDGRKALRQEMLRFIQGMRGTRKNPVTAKQIRGWFHNTDNVLIDAVLAGLIREGEVVVKGGQHTLAPPYKVVYFYPDGSVLDATRYDTEADARDILEGSIALMEPGERVVLLNRGDEIDAFPLL